MVAEPVILHTIEHGDKTLGPALVLQRDDLQRLMDTLWKSGVRPSNGEGNVGQIGAIKYHLEDMRKLVFKGGPCSDIH